MLTLSKVLAKAKCWALGLMLLVSMAPMHAIAYSPPSLVIAQVKVATNSQFITLYNSGDQPADMSAVFLQYFNHYSLPSSTSSKSIQLGGVLAPHAFYMIVDGPVDLCFQTSVNSTALGFSTKAGMVQVNQMVQLPGGGITATTLDYVRWSSGVVAGVQTLPTTPAFLQRQLNSGLPVTNGTWQAVTPKTNDPCALVTYVIPPTPPEDATPHNQLLPGVAPTATFVTIAGGMGGGPSLPAGDKGLRSPVLTEVLPNPAPPLTDADGEFVELYNSNKVSFDLSGFKIQTQSIGSKTPHVYTIPQGTKIAGHGYKSFTSADTSISLSNSGGQVWLLDPFGNVLSKCDVYGSAKEGQSWTLGNGKWYWSATPSQNRANVISQVSTGANQVKSTNLPGIDESSKSGTAGQSGANGTSGGAGATNNPGSLHPLIIVAIVLLALLYWAYEYRQDIANKIRQFRANRANRRQNRK